MDFLRKSEEMLNNNAALRIIFYAAVVGAMIAVKLYTGSETVHFIYSEF